MKPSLQALQPLGRALMLPIAVLPIAGLLLRLGQADLLDVPFVSAAGGAIFDNLGLLFAIGIGVGLARDSNGAAGLAGAVCFLVATRGAETLLTVPPDVVAGLAKDSATLASDAWRAKAIAKLSVPIGILSGIGAGALYNRYATIKLPDYLAFFGGRRFVPILSGLLGLLLAAVVGSAYASINAGMDGLSRAVIGSGFLGLFVYGVLNRLLLITGLHHILNNVAWFIVGDYHGTTGDLKRFFAGDPTAGAFMSGFFPVMMFGLPAACFAMYRSALPERRKAVGGMLLSMGLTSFLTGVTEPIEFTFIFLAPLLFLIHALLTGAAMAVTHTLGVLLGFGFSAGFFDYVLNFSKATRPLWLLPIGAVYALLYYGIFRFAIVHFDLKTPGREEQPVGEEIADAVTDRGEAYVAALGGAANLRSIDACTTRLRLLVDDQAKVDERRLRALGAVGFVRPSPDGLQVVVGPIADAVAMEMRAAAGPLQSTDARSPVEKALAPAANAGPWIKALGGRDNVLEAGSASSRVWLRVADAGRVDRGKLTQLGVRMIAQPAPGIFHLLLGDAEPVAEALQGA
ncbi:MAG: N-acetylglucosamine system or component [Sphingomonadales bacterium]|nr:N-acetylglucosamine system or component [Sphingomonadales bacterium]